MQQADSVDVRLLHVFCIQAINFCSLWPHHSFYVIVRNSFPVSITTAPPCIPFLILAVHFSEHSGSQQIVCLFLLWTFREEELQGKVSWQLIPGQRFEAASFNLIRNHLCTLTSPLNLGFADTLSLFLSLTFSSTSSPPPCFFSICPLLCFFFLMLSPPLSVSWWSGGFSSLTHRLNTESIVYCWEVQCIFHARGNALWLVKIVLFFFYSHREKDSASNDTEPMTPMLQSLCLLGKD